MNHPSVAKPDFKNFRCVRCGNCCTGGPGYVWVTIEEITSIAAKLNMSLEEFGPRFLRLVSNRYSLLEKPTGDCIFYDRSKGCTVYDARPEQCRAFPADPEGKFRFPAWMIDQCEGIKRMHKL